MSSVFPRFLEKLTCYHLTYLINIKLILLTPAVNLFLLPFPRISRRRLVSNNVHYHEVGLQISVPSGKRTGSGKRCRA
jgi:hypothetical protein